MILSEKDLCKRLAYLDDSSVVAANVLDRERGLGRLYHRNIFNVPVSTNPDSFFFSCRHRGVDHEGPATKAIWTASGG